MFGVLILFFFYYPNSYAQTDTSLKTLAQTASKYVATLDDKIDNYNNSITSKTEKTLKKLSIWENKIERILSRASLEIAKKLFANNQLTFTSLLEKVKMKNNVLKNYTHSYNQYVDNVSVNLKFLQTQKKSSDTSFEKTLIVELQKLNYLEITLSNNEAVKAFIKERKHRLVDESIKTIGKSKYLKKINKEAYYYEQALSNYKKTFSEPKNIEEAAIKMLSKIPGFQKFAAKNSELSGIFGLPVNYMMMPGKGSSPVINGLASRVSLQEFSQNNILKNASTNLHKIIHEKKVVIPSELQQVQTLITDSKEVLKKKAVDFIPNSQRTKPFLKRIETSADLQFGESIQFLPATINIALKIGYKLNDKSSAGIGIGYLAGIGQGWNKINFTNEGLGLRTFIKWKLSKGFDLQGGSEWNYVSRFKNITELKNTKPWKQSALIGLSKKYDYGKKMKGNLQALYDFLYNSHIPITQPFLFRFGYNFN